MDCKKHIIYSDSWSSKREEYRCLNCSFKAVDDYKWYYEVSYKDEIYYVPNFSKIMMITNESFEVPRRLTKWTQGAGLTDDVLYEFINTNKISR